MSDYPTLSVTMLGAGQEVGRSCCVIQYRGKTVVCDAGTHPAHNGMSALPFIDDLDWSTVDAILVTHFHIDHAASLTYIMEKTNFRDGKGKVYMTHPTKGVYRFLMQDFMRISSTSTDGLFTSVELSMSLASIMTVSAHQLITVSPGLSFTPYHAGHVLGACMFLIDIAGLRILYTGDYSREEDRHLVKAEIPPVRPDVLIVESTYGVQGHEERDTKEHRFTNLVHSIIRRGGHALLPVFALGRAQELLLILEDYWKKHPDLHNVPIYYASNLARKCMAVYQTYIHTMNSNIRSRFAKRDNPFVFKHVSNIPQVRGWEKRIAEGPPCVILCTPGMLQPGPSRELLELWAPDPRNGLIITGYSVEGTLARDIVNEPQEIPSVKGDSIPRRLSVDYISFSAHVDGPQNIEFIEQVKAQHIVLVHGDAAAMNRLRVSLQQRYKDREEEIKIHTPRNLETLKLTFRGERVAKAIGTLASNPPKPNSVLSGLLVSKDYSYTLLDPRDLRDFAGLSTCIVTQRQKVVLNVGWELVRWHLEGMYGGVEEGLDSDGVPTMRVMGAVDVKHTQEHELTLEWESSASNDMIADSCLALIIGIDTSPASVKLTTHPHNHDKPHPHADDPENENSMIVRIQRLAMFLEAHFGEVELHMPEAPPVAGEDGSTDNADSPGLLIGMDDAEAFVDLATMTVESSSEQLRKRVESVLDMALTTVSSLSELYTSEAPLVQVIGEPELVKEKSASLGIIEEERSDLPATEGQAEDVDVSHKDAVGGKEMQEDNGATAEGEKDVMEPQSQETADVPPHSQTEPEADEGSGSEGEGTEDDDSELQVHA
ncbi:Metallo-hydrolase/oxidoreductase [Fomitiporia mediterranea MF3/22]|uniref:Metallo-hydrolase/oxidoreductase n=1 Tax=Fomitiporia mediterranea (strain MF3/22) TaxID=694068 RepID=UPI00044072B7|nr:Metallo-hydrolase/oxidoreductase [Fomitiporia mediterranea MF3/22]EJD03061.1 Metallo-hydrolase/oxidoreductase [Fomitiporia mediterranea MF3/22]